MRKSILGVVFLVFAAFVALAVTGYTADHPAKPAGPEAKQVSGAANSAVGPELDQTDQTFERLDPPMQDVPCSPGDSCGNEPGMACRRTTGNGDCHCSTAKNKPLCS